MSARQMAYRLLVGDVARRVTPDIYRRLVVMLFEQWSPIVIITVVVAVFGILVRDKTGASVGTYAAIFGMALGAIRLAHLQRFRRTLATRRSTEEFRRCDMVFSLLSILFGANLGVLATAAILNPDYGVRALGYVLCIGYGTGIVSRGGFRAWSTKAAVLAMLIPSVSAMVAVVLRGESQHWDIDLALLLLIVTYAVGGFLAANEIERRVVEHLMVQRDYYLLAHIDPLTGAANRLSLPELFEEARAYDGRVAVHCIDLDRFKPVNDRHGHAAGDMVLKTVVARIRRDLREGDALVRMGGDEFIVLQANVRDAHDVDALARRLIDDISAPFLIEGHRVQIGASIGSAIAVDGQSLEATSERADKALYRAKAAGRGRAISAELAA